jgi:hypothetical protein
VAISWHDREAGREFAFTTALRQAKVGLFERVLGALDPTAAQASD